MANKTYADFINIIISQTKDGKIEWHYLDDNRDLYHGMGWTKTETDYDLLFRSKETIVPDFNTEDSFFASMKSTEIVLYVKGSNPACMYIVPSTYKNVLLLSAKEYGDHITRLLNLVRLQFPDAKRFIEDFVANPNMVEE